MALLESGEMYLETILILSQKKPYVRAIDVGEYMGYSKPSVSRAMGLLKSGGYVTVREDGHITLTDAGREVAENIYGMGKQQREEKGIRKYCYECGARMDTSDTAPGQYAD